MANPFQVNVPNAFEALMIGSKAYDGASMDRALSDASQAIKTGDNKALMDALLRAKQIGPAIEVAKLDRQSAAAQQFGQDLGGIFGGAPSNPAQPAMPQRQPVSPVSPLSRLMTPEAPPAPTGPSSNLTADGTTITGVDYGPVTDGASGRVIAPGAGYVPEPPAKSPPQRMAQAPQIGPSPSLGGVSLDKAVPTLLRHAMNPSLPKEQQEMARMLLGKAFDQYPEEIRKLELFQKRPDLFQMAKDLKQAGANQNTINMPPQEKAYDAKMGAELAELNRDLIKGAATARSNIANIDRLGQLLNDPTVYQGTAGERVLQAKRLAKSIGIDVGDVGPAEAAQAITSQLALNARSPAGGAGMPGAMSDADRDYLKAMQPGIERTPGGNKLIIDVTRKINQRAVDVEKFRQDYVKRNGRLNEGFNTELQEWADKNPLFPNAPAAPSGTANIPPPPAGFIRNK
jgi:hypothetical protein